VVLKAIYENHDNKLFKGKLAIVLCILLLVFGPSGDSKWGIKWKNLYSIDMMAHPIAKYWRRIAIGNIFIEL